jgi:predicted GNAT superfamily acetyltransferase
LLPELFPQILELNALAHPAVALLDGAELCRLSEIPNEHLVLKGIGGQMQGYTLAFYRDAPYDGEEFLAFRKLLQGPFLYVDQIVISPRVRGIGIGKSVYERLAADALRRGVAQLCCEVNIVPPNPASNAFHSRLGFERIGELATQDGRHVCLLRKRLTSGTEA